MKVATINIRSVKLHTTEPLRPATGGGGGERAAAAITTNTGARYGCGDIISWGSWGTAWQSSMRSTVICLSVIQESRYTWSTASL